MDGRLENRNTPGRLDWGRSVQLVLVNLTVVVVAPFSLSRLVDDRGFGGAECKPCGH